MRECVIPYLLLSRHEGLLWGLLQYCFTGLEIETASPKKGSACIMHVQITSQLNLIWPSCIRNGPHHSKSSMLQPYYTATVTRYSTPYNTALEPPHYPCLKATGQSVKSLLMPMWCKDYSYISRFSTTQVKLLESNEQNPKISETYHRDESAL